MPEGEIGWANRELLKAAAAVARPVSSLFPVEMEAKALAAMSCTLDFEVDLCKAGIHSDSFLHPLECPERKK